MSGNAAKTLAAGFGLADHLLDLVTSDLDDAMARRRLRDTSGPSMAYNFGHLLHYRIQALGLLGVQVDDPWKDKFGFAEATDGADYPTVAEFVAAWKGISAMLHEALGKATDEQIFAPLPSPDGPHGEKKLLDTLSFIAWHEAYHFGQNGTLRTHYGMKATSTLAMEAAGIKVDG